MSAATSLHTARGYVRAAIVAFDADPRSARPDLVAAERALSEALEEYTPVQPPAASDVRKAHESSSGFKAVGRVRSNPAKDEP